jgi:hypothetical protein
VKSEAARPGLKIIPGHAAGAVLLELDYVM